MLTITENAGTVVKTLADRAAIETAADAQPGLRISSAADGSTFEVAVAERPAPSDQVVSSDGARVYLQEEAARVLDRMVLDARVDEAGSVHFSVAAAA
ncbi:Fe-S cluster assembly protein HesB [Herbiconiux liangxiaofengii]|uniref:Fe-S cluster assembly protein HesB n=1 Tax=Herbiconiux liangxiaofengii TaxID=3342795 RepID=UPI0035BA4503